MKIRFIHLAGLAAIHLVLVVCGAAHLQLISPDNVLGRTLATYCAASGADASYGFFAPRVSPQLRAEFVLTDAQGKTWTDKGDWGRTHEATLRMESSIGMVEVEELREGIAASWAAAMFGRYPNAQTVEMKVEFQDLPSMPEYQAGERPHWLPMYEIKFTRGGAPAVTSEPVVRNE